jgi:hypothetical protein
MLSAVERGILRPGAARIHLLFAIGYRLSSGGFAAWCPSVVALDH